MKMHWTEFMVLISLSLFTNFAFAESVSVTSALQESVQEMHLAQKNYESENGRMLGEENSDLTKDHSDVDFKIEVRQARKLTTVASTKSE